MTHKEKLTSTNDHHATAKFDFKTSQDETASLDTKFSIDNNKQFCTIDSQETDT